MEAADGRYRVFRDDEGRVVAEGLCTLADGTVVRVSKTLYEPEPPRQPEPSPRDPVTIPAHASPLERSLAYDRARARAATRPQAPWQRAQSRHPRPRTQAAALEAAEAARAAAYDVVAQRVERQVARPEPPPSATVGTVVDPDARQWATFQALDNLAEAAAEVEWKAKYG
jgi:hypothetical protein